MGAIEQAKAIINEFYSKMDTETLKITRAVMDPDKANPLAIEVLNDIIKEREQVQ